MPGFAPNPASWRRLQASRKRRAGDDVMGRSAEAVMEPCIVQQARIRPDARPLTMK